METNRLKQFCTIVEAGSMTRAAHLLGISHSGLSKSISILQNEVGFALFQPEGRGILVTEAGQVFYKKAQLVLKSVDDLNQKVLSRDKTILRFGVLEIFTSYFMGRLISQLFPDHSIEVLELAPGEIENAMAEGRIDLGLTDLPVPRPEIDYLDLCSVQSGVYSLREKFSKLSLSELPFVVPSISAPSNPLGIKERDGWPEGLFPRKKVFYVNLLSTALDLTRSGACAIYIPNFVADLHNKSVDLKFRLEAVKLPSDFPLCAEKYI